MADWTTPSHTPPPPDDTPQANTPPANMPRAFSLNATMARHARRVNTLLVLAVLLWACIQTVTMLQGVGHGGSVVLLAWINTLCANLPLPLAACLIVSLLLCDRAASRS